MPTLTKLWWTFLCTGGLVAVYRLLVTNDWSYVAIVIEAEDGAVRLSQALQSMSKADQRVCFPIVIQLTSSTCDGSCKSSQEL
uniref:ANF_receptor domain-containing protein n=1 Tax=Macrostomum lignano TaxID=282301 RepID=A0A1I8JFQ9_9PLAT